MNNLVEKKTFVFVGDEHPALFPERSDLESRGANFILSNNFIQNNTYLVLEFLCSDKGHSEIINQFLDMEPTCFVVINPAKI